MSVLNLVPRAVGQSDPDCLYAEISTSMPAPQSFDDPLYVVIPDWNPDIYFTVLDWVACHGTTLPPAGNIALVEYDDQNNLRCTWWSGTTKFEVAVAGDVTGTIGDTVVETVRGGLVPVARTDAAGGALAGTYPNPGLAAKPVGRLGFNSVGITASAGYNYMGVEGNGWAASGGMGLPFDPTRGYEPQVPVAGWYRCTFTCRLDAASANWAYLEGLLVVSGSISALNGYSIVHNYASQGATYETMVIDMTLQLAALATINIVVDCGYGNVTVQGVNSGFGAYLAVEFLSIN